ncbi:MAG: hypothetical protein V7784_07195 [Oceanospirillaceae bacterium]
MDALLTELFSFPLVLFAFPGLVLVLLWLVSLIGLFDIEMLDFDLKSESDAEVEGSHLFERLGLDGIPLLVVMTLIDFYGLAFAYTAKKYFLPLMDDILTATVAGGLIAFFSFLLAVPVAAVCIKPLRRMFVVHQGEAKDELIGLICTVTTQTVTHSFGQATSDDGLVIVIRAAMPNTITKGSRIVLLEYFKGEDCYTVITEEELRQPS